MSCVPQGKKSSFVNLVVLIALTVAVFSRVLRNEFVWDDTLFLTNVDAYRTFDFKRFFLTLGNGLEFLPIRDLSYVLDFALWGENSTGFHFTNLLLYLLTVVAVYFFTVTIVTTIQLTADSRKQLAPTTVAFWTAALFALMPIHSEAVNFIGGGRNTLLAALFAFLASRYFVQLLGSDGNCFLNWRFGTAFILYILAVLSKATAITLPFFFLGLCAVIRSRPLIARMAVTTPFLLVSGIFYIQYTSIAAKAGLIRQPEVNLTIANKIAVAVQIPFFYLGKFIIPTNLSTDYGTPFPSSLASPFAIASLIAVMALTLLAFVFRNRAPLFFVAVCWYGVLLIPALHLLPTAVIVADRYAYLPSFAFCVLLTLLGITLRMRWPFTITIAAVALLFVYGLLAFQQNSIWRSNLTLWQHTVSVSPRSVQAMENLGTIYYYMGEHTKALDVLYGIQQVEPLNPIYDFFEGKYFWERSDFPRATISFERAIGKKSDLIDALYYLADICEKTKNFDCAITYYQRLIASTDLERGPYKKIAKERLAVLSPLKTRK